MAVGTEASSGRGEFVKVATLDQLTPGTLLSVEMPDGLKICLAHTEDGEIYAVIDRCSHRDFPLSTGTLHGGATIECSWHGARFDLKSGRAIRLPAFKGVQTFEVKVDGSDILVATDE
jgi:3-phenylpropionate/trans-cinnamate dioxygenase ferredoxin subunit